MVQTKIRGKSSPESGLPAVLSFNSWIFLSLRLRFCLLFFCGLLTGSALSAQIINVESSRIHSDTTGWLGKAGAGFSYTKNVQEVLNMDLSAHLQYKTEKDLYLFLGNYNLLRGNSRSLVNNMFYHLRYNRKLNRGVRWEAFTQWQQNIVTNIELRALVGTGPRFKLHDSKKFKLFAATLAMYEYEKGLKSGEVHRDMRSDNYVSLTFQPNNIFSLTSTTFYQPLFRMLKDYRILNQLNLEVKATRHFSIVTNWSYLFDAFPPEGTPRTNLSITNGFAYKF